MTDQATTDGETTEIVRFDDPFSGAVTRLVNWPEGLVLWHGGEIVWRSWGPKAERPAPRGEGTEAVATMWPESPFPVGSTTNCKTVGWNAYFQSKSRDRCPFPTAREDLQRGYREGWDAAAESHLSISRRPTEPLYAHPPVAEAPSVVGALEIAKEALLRLSVGTERTFNAATAKQMAASTTAIASDAMNRILAALSSAQDGSLQPASRASVPSQREVRLVLAARAVAFGDEQEAIKELDAASEAYAADVPWDDEPEEVR